LLSRTQSKSACSEAFTTAWPGAALIASLQFWL
jgi:hypothetical protein